MRRRAAVQDDLASNGQVLEIACDESGYEGEKLVGGTTDVFAHAGVRLSIEAATECVRELRRRIRSPATEYKANHVLREKHRPVLLWLLGPSGPLHGNAHVYLVDKAYLAVRTVVGLLLGTASEAPRPDPDHPDIALYREGRRAFDRDHWQDFLVASNDLMRAKDATSIAVEAFFHTVGTLRLVHGRGRVDEILGLFEQARPLAESFRARLQDDPTMMPAMDPLMPAIVRAVGYWGAGRRPVSIVHDRQNTLSRERVARLTETSRVLSPGGRLTDLRLVQAGLDARIQAADFLAGVARKVASDELDGRGDAELAELLRPYVDAFSIWGDDRSWSRLRPWPQPVDGPSRRAPRQSRMTHRLDEPAHPVLPARDGEQMPVRSAGQDWLTSWHPGPRAPAGTPHGAAGVCVSAEGEVVLISHDGTHWGFPAGRPEVDERIEETLRREMLEEACAIVVDARLLSFARSQCVGGRQTGLVIVRSYWRAEVEIAPWEPRFEIRHRRVIAATDAKAQVRDPDVAATRISHRALDEAGLG